MIVVLNRTVADTFWNYDNLLSIAGLEIATDAVTNATNIFSLATKNSDLVATLVTRFLYDLQLGKLIKRVKLKQTFHLFFYNNIFIMEMQSTF